VVRSTVGHPPPLPVTRFEVRRFAESQEWTLGALYELAPTQRFLCFTLEDQAQAGHKIRGETRIPAGIYDLELRREGGFHQRYSSRFTAIHEGMIHVLSVPNFEFILWHVGNDDNDTEGCLLLGDVATVRGRLERSTDAYKRVYPIVRDAIKHGRTTVTYVDPSW
jgi:hypothetical protein